LLRCKRVLVGYFVKHSLAVFLVSELGVRVILDLLHEFLDNELLWELRFGLLLELIDSLGEFLVLDGLVLNDLFNIVLLSLLIYVLFDNLVLGALAHLLPHLEARLHRVHSLRNLSRVCAQSRRGS